EKASACLPALGSRYCIFPREIGFSASKIAQHQNSRSGLVWRSSAIFTQVRSASDGRPENPIAGAPGLYGGPARSSHKPEAPVRGAQNAVWVGSAWGGIVRPPPS